MAKDGGELQCVEECPHWWYKERDGICKEEKWRKSTAIAVPIVLVVAVAITVVVILILKKKRAAKQKKLESEKSQIKLTTVTF